MSQPTEEASIPQLHSFQTSQPTNDQEPPANENLSIQVDEPEGEEAAGKESKPKSKARKASSTGDLNVIDIDDEEEESSGTSVLPLSKIKKIFKTDPEHVSASEAAVFSTAIATELFIQYFTEQASLIARSEKRKKLQYKDFASAVSNIEQLNFLSDTVPKTVNLKKLVDQNKANYSTSKNNQPIAKGQQVLNLGKPQKHAGDDEDLPDSDPEEIKDDDDEDNDGGANADEDDGETANRSIDEENNNNTEDEDEGEVTGHSIDQDKDVVMTE